jgi:diguanylate cyclase (GGDEF)-like protein
LHDVASRLRGCVPARQTVARLAGDEFAILLEEVTGIEEAVLLAEKISGSISQPFEIEPNQLRVALTAGIAFASGTENAEQLLKNADMALCDGKRSRKRAHLLGRVGKPRSYKAS